MKDVLEAIQNDTLTYQQKVVRLAQLAESTLNVLSISPKIQEYRETGVICDLGEGNAPYRPRYIVPDYELFMQNGSAFLGLVKPLDIWDAVNNLLILYKHVPSITTFPVFVGALDSLLEPFVQDEKEAEKAIKFLLLHIDRTINDSFCHANLGPKATKAGSIIMKLQGEMQNAIPNISLRYDPAVTPDSFMKEAINCALLTAKPSFANHTIFKNDFSALGISDYAIASCYNGLPIGGGSFTLVRLNLKALAEKYFKSKDSKIDAGKSEFLEMELAESVRLMLAYMDVRVRFLVEEARFFETSFLVKEGLIHADRFTAMFGLVGLAECANAFTENDSERFGKGKSADAFALQVIDKISTLVNAHKAPHVHLKNKAYLLHAQVGIDSDIGVSPGCRVPIGEEPQLLDHLLVSASYHKYFISGIGDVFAFEPTAKKNPEHILDIIKGAFSSGLRYLSAYSSDSDVVRITGYLVKRSEIAKLENGEASLQDTTALGMNAVNNLKVLDRKVRS